MANRKVGGRKRGSLPCWTLPFLGAVFVFEAFFSTDDPPEDEPWYGENSTDLSVSRVASNDTQVMKLFSPDEDLLDLMMSVDGKGAKGQSIAALVLGGLTYFFCLLILLAYGDMDKVRLKLEKFKC